MLITEELLNLINYQNYRIFINRIFLIIRFMTKLNNNFKMINNFLKILLNN